MRRPVREIPFTDIEQAFEVAGASYWWNDTYHPAVSRTDAGYSIRIVTSVKVTRADTSTKFDYFKLDRDGTVLVAPWGYAKDYRPGRVAGLDEAVARYAQPSPDAPRLRI